MPSDQSQPGSASSGRSGSAKCPCLCLNLGLYKELPGEDPSDSWATSRGMVAPNTAPAKCQPHASTPSPGDHMSTSSLISFNSSPSDDMSPPGQPDRNANLDTRPPGSWSQGKNTNHNSALDFGPYDKENHKNSVLDSKTRNEKTDENSRSNSRPSEKDTNQNASLPGGSRDGVDQISSPSNRLLHKDTNQNTTVDCRSLGIDSDQNFLKSSDGDDGQNRSCNKTSQNTELNNGSHNLDPNQNTGPDSESHDERIIQNALGVIGSCRRELCGEVTSVCVEPSVATCGPIVASAWLSRSDCWDSTSPSPTASASTLSIGPTEGRDEEGEEEVPARSVSQAARPTKAKLDLLQLAPAYRSASYPSRRYMVS